LFRINSIELITVFRFYHISLYLTIFIIKLIIIIINLIIIIILI